LQAEKVSSFIETFDVTAPALSTQASGSSPSGASNTGAAEDANAEVDDILKARDSAQDEAEKKALALEEALKVVKEFSKSSSTSDRAKLRKVLRYTRLGVNF